MTRLFTIGHSTRPVDELIELLERHRVRTLVDVRRFPGSRRHPQYNRDALARSLAGRGIRYRHAPGLGGRRGRPDAASPNTGWRNASFRAYADHLATAEFRSALDQVLEDAAAAPVALMCAEAVPWRCHRQLIADALVVRGHAVRHITSGAEPAPHALNEMARPDGAGGLTYPGEPPAQRELFP